MPLMHIAHARKKYQNTYRNIQVNIYKRNQKIHIVIQLRSSLRLLFSWSASHEKKKRLECCPARLRENRCLAQTMSRCSRRWIFFVPVQVFKFCACVRLCEKCFYP